MSRRSVVDYALARRSTLAGLRNGRASTADVCDAHPYLLRAARYHGEPTEASCPVCRRGPLVHVTYTYGDCFAGEAQGRARASAELARLASELADFRVFVVEVCTDCGWNHLVTSYVLGTGEVAARPGRRRAGR